MDIRPRTLGEILDDAWRLALADAPLLLLFNALFLVPSFILMLLVLAHQTPSGIAQGVLPAIAALLLPLMGLASGACQELFRRRASDEPILARAGLTAALRRGLVHAAVRGVLLCLMLPGLLLLICGFLPSMSPILRFLGFLGGSLLTFLLSLPLWGACTSVHVLVNTDALRSGTLLRELWRDVAAAPGKAAALVLSRLSLLFLLALQLHLLGKVILWIADNLAGFDTSMLDVQLAFLGNPLYTTALFLLTWLLLSPFFEAGNFLLHTDIRTRQEGLDLQYRVQRAFGVPANPDNRQVAKDAKEKQERRTTSKSNLSFLFFFLGVLAVRALSGGALRAEEAPRVTIHAVRADIDAIRTEIEKTEPYPGGQRWTNRLSGLRTKLVRADGDDARRYRWFDQALTDFGDRKKEDALHILKDLSRRLSLLEEALSREEADDEPRRSPEEVKALLRGSEGRKVDRASPRQRVEDDRREIRREEVRREEGGKEPEGEAPHGGSRGRAVSVPKASGGSLSFVGWLLLGGLALAVIAVGVFLYVTSPRSPSKPKLEAGAGTEKLEPDSDARQVLEESPASLWRQAETLAGEGHFRDAVRILYLAVLALLHRQHLIRFEPTRTNGEYVRQVRLSEQAPAELHEPFARLTHQFEMAWYGERPCETADYRACRTLADEMQLLAGGKPSRARSAAE